MNTPEFALPTEAGLYEVILRSPAGEKVWTYHFTPETEEWRQYWGGSKSEIDSRVHGYGLAIDDFDGNEKVLKTVVAWEPFRRLYPTAAHGALYQKEANKARLAEREDVLRRKRAFIEKHAALLNELVWKVCYLEPEIELGNTYHRGEVVGAQEIAQLWHGVKWRREKPRYSFDEDKSRDWVGELDGITLRIVKAEEFKPVWIPKDGPIHFDEKEGGEQ